VASEYPAAREVNGVFYALSEFVPIGERHFVVVSALCADSFEPQARRYNLWLN
jgi:hypothetical protein